MLYLFVLTQFWTQDRFPLLLELHTAQTIRFPNPLAVRSP